LTYQVVVPVSKHHPILSQEPNVSAVDFSGMIMGWTASGNEFVPNALMGSYPDKKDAMPHLFTDAIALLKADHRKIRDLFRQFDHAKSASRRKMLVREICIETRIHLTVEEDTFPSTSKVETRREHARTLIGDIEAALDQDVPFAGMVAMLSEKFAQHIHEQESLSGGQFAVSRKSGVDLVALRDRIAAHKERYLRQSEPGTGAKVRPVPVTLRVAA
jgi:hypothetical protein